jgi:branched-chain amino acid aminotransferase
MLEKLQSLWVDGNLVPWDHAKVSILTHTLHYGLGAFEGIRAYRRADGRTYVFRLREHINRLFDSCRLILISPAFSPAEVEAACLETLRANGLTEGYLRPMVYIGEGAMGIFAPDNPIRTAVVVWKWGATQGNDALDKGIRAKISSFARHHVNGSLVKAKMMGQYSNGVLAKYEVKLAGYDEAILLDPNGYVSEASGANVFLIKHGVLMTPDKSCSILEGITRGSVITLAREMGYEVQETRLTRDQLWLADEAFIAGTASEITPLREIDDRPIGDGQFTITKKLQARFFDIARGSDASHPEWLTLV